MSRIRLEVWDTKHGSSKGHWVALDLRSVSFAGYEVIIGYQNFRVLVDDRVVFSTVEVKA